VGIDESLIQEIVRRILTVAKPDKIILFGSAAAGQMTRDSDIDLVVVEPDPGDRQTDSDLYAVVRGEQERHRWHRVSGQQVREGDL